MPDDPTTGVGGYEAKGKFLPSQFIGYAEGPEKNTLFIYLAGGQVIYAQITMAGLEQAMKEYWKEIAKAQIAGSRIVQLPGAGGGSKHHN